jgi:protein SCO1/2
VRRALPLVLLLAVFGASGDAHATRPAVQQVDIDEHLGALLPLELPFVDQDRHPVQLRDYFHDGKPVVLVLAYFRCPMLCDLVLHGVLHSLTKQHLVLGRDYRALTVSIDPKDTPAAAARKQQGMLQGLDMPDKTAAWPFLTGAQPNVKALADRLGFEYAYDPKSDQYAHPAVAFVLTPEGRISRYLYGVKFRPLDVRLALDEAAHGKIGGIVDRVLLCCFRYDPATRRYGWYVKGVLRGGATLTLLIVGGGLGLLWWRERRRRDDA